jgi:hypothetical protein
MKLLVKFLYLISCTLDLLIQNFIYDLILIVLAVYRLVNFSFGFLNLRLQDAVVGVFEHIIQALLESV